MTVRPSRLIVGAMVLVALILALGGAVSAKSTVRLVKPEPVAENRFADDLIDVTFRFDRDQVNLTVANKYTTPVKVIWDQTAFIDVDGAAERVIHTGVKYADKDKPQTPSIIPPGAKVVETIIPSNYVIWQFNSWVKRPLFKAWTLDQMVGKTAGVQLAIEVNSEVKYYNFGFEVVKL